MTVTYRNWKQHDRYTFEFLYPIRRATIQGNVSRVRAQRLVLSTARNETGEIIWKWNQMYWTEKITDDREISRYPKRFLQNCNAKFFYGFLFLRNAASVENYNATEQNLTGFLLLSGLCFYIVQFCTVYKKNTGCLWVKAVHNSYLRWSNYSFLFVCLFIRQYWVFVMFDYTAR